MTPQECSIMWIATPPRPPRLSRRARPCVRYRYHRTSSPSPVRVTTFSFVGAYIHVFSDLQTHSADLLEENSDMQNAMKGLESMESDPGFNQRSRRQFIPLSHGFG